MEGQHDTDAVTQSRTEILQHDRVTHHALQLLTDVDDGNADAVIEPPNNAIDPRAVPGAAEEKSEDNRDVRDDEWMLSQHFNVTHPADQRPIHVIGQPAGQ